MGRLVENQASAHTRGSYGRSRMYEVTDEGKGLFIHGAPNKGEKTNLRYRR